MVLVKQMDTPPLFADNTEYAAGLVRRLLGQMIGDTVGIFGLNDFAVTLSGSSVTVAPGRAAIPGTATESSVYLVEATGATALTLDPADSTRDRTDRLIAYVVPPVTGADTGKWFFEIRKGTPAATPVPPDTPNAYVVWEFTVPAASKGTNPSGFDKRFSGPQQFIAGPTITSFDKPTTGRNGQIWTNALNAEMWCWNGAMWLRVNDPSLPRGWVGEVKRATTDNFSGSLVMERVTVSLFTGRRYKASFNTTHFSTGNGPPNADCAIRLAAGTSVTDTSPTIVSSGIQKNSITQPSYQLFTTFTVVASGTYTLGVTANSNGNPGMTMPGGNGRVFLVEDIGAA